MKCSSAAILALAGILPFVAGCRHGVPPAAAKPTGVIEGTITVHGIPAKPSALSKAQESRCAPLQPNRRFRQDHMHHSHHPAVFIWISGGLKNRDYAPPSQSAVLTRFGCRFLPSITGVMAGQPVDFTNSNPIPATIHVMPHVSGNPAFTLTLPAHRPGKTHVFSKPELMIPVTSPGHPGMRAFINVVSNPFYAVPGPESHFVIRGIPPGTYTLAAVQPELGTQTRSVTVRANSITHADFTFSASPTPPSHQRKK